MAPEPLAEVGLSAEGIAERFDRTGLVCLEDVVSLNVIAGNGQPSRSFTLHYDACVTTVVIPLIVPNGG